MDKQLLLQQFSLLLDKVEKLEKQVNGLAIAQHINGTMNESVERLTKSSSWPKPESIDKTFHEKDTEFLTGMLKHATSDWDRNFLTSIIDSPYETVTQGQYKKIKEIQTKLKYEL